MTAPSQFGYKTVITSDGSNRLGSLIAYRLAEDLSLQAVMWAADRKIWMFAPAIAVQFIYDPEYMTFATEVDRATAERTARDELTAELPSEAELARMCAEGERMGWEMGPPRQSTGDN
jgi:hypothetical protein